MAEERGGKLQEQKHQEDQQEEQQKEEEAAATEKGEDRLTGTRALSTPWEIMSASTSCQQELQPLISCRHRVPALTGGQGLEEEEEERKEKLRKEKRLEMETRPPCQPCLHLQARRWPRLHFLPLLLLLLLLPHQGPLLPALLPSASPATTRSRAARKSALAAPLRWAGLQGSICREGACQS